MVTHNRMVMLNAVMDVEGDAGRAKAAAGAVAGRQRASLDTLALTSDLASYPLKFDLQPKEAVPPVPRI